MTQRILFLAFNLMLGAFFVQAQQQWTLQECIDLALEKNISVKQASLDYLDSGIEKKAAVANFLPTLNGGGTHSWNIGLNQNITTGLLENVTTQFSSMRMNVGIDIFKGLQNVNQLHRANLALLAAEYKLADMKEDVMLLVANAYLQVLFNKESLEVQQSQLALNLEQLARVKEQVDLGTLPKGDLFEVEANVATQEQALVVASNTYTIAKLSLAQLLLIEDVENFEVADVEYGLPVSNVLQNVPQDVYYKALENRNDIKLSLTNIDIAQKDLAIAKGAYLPQLTGFYGYSTRISYADQLQATGDFLERTIGYVEGSGTNVLSQYPKTRVVGPDPFFDQWSRNEGHNFGVQLNIPIFNGLATRNNVNRRKVNVERNKYIFEQQKIDLQNTITRAHNDANAALKTFEAAQKSLEARNLAFQYAKDRFEFGAMNAFDFSQAQQRYETAQSELIRAKYDYIFKVKIVEFYFGIPMQLEN